MVTDAGGMATPAFADHDDDRDSSCDTQITSSFIASDSRLALGPVWLVSGSCLEKLKNVTLANDWGDGFEELLQGDSQTEGVWNGDWFFISDVTFDISDLGIGDNEVIVIPLVARSAPFFSGLEPVGQYLL
jgi:hypothetical protein